MKTQLITYTNLDPITRKTIDSKLYGMGFKKEFKNSLVIEFGDILRNGERELLSIITPKGSKVRFTKNS